MLLVESNNVILAFTIIFTNNKDIFFFTIFRVKSGKFGRSAKFGQRLWLFHILIFGIKNQLSKQTMKIQMRRLTRSRLIWISSVCKCVSEFTWCPKLSDFTLEQYMYSIIPTTLKKLKGHIALGVSVCPFVRPFVYPFKKISYGFRIFINGFLIKK